MKTFAAVIVILLIITGVAHSEEQTLNLAGMSVTVWSGPAGSRAKEPVIIFSHGFHGCATQSRFLTEAFASAGYLVFAPNHRDATCHGGKGSWFSRPNVSFRKPEGWSEDLFRDRGDDLRRLIDALKADARFRDRADWSRVGFAGHSLGGYTILGLAGAWPGWKLTGIKAVLALSPYTQPFVVHETLSGVSTPVMYQSGTWDFAIAPAIVKESGGYDQTPAPKYYVEFRRAGHFAWTDIPSSQHGQIVSYSLAFMNHYVKGEAPDPILTHPSEVVSTLRYASELGQGEIRKP
jgi:predicted dienelactone hydrolase